ncbi:docking protein 3 [Sardina pilchardus]|uniref:docking protein 3 n=1 Tax=Sardina pilchardus TaxID=27697 RepID=UPI002E152FDD
MDIVEKEGLVMIQGMKFGKKSWKRTWMILFQPSSSGIGRIELYEVRDGPGTSARPPGLKKMEKRVIRLSDCFSIVLAPEENCPADFSAFDLNTAQRTYTIATPTVEGWHQILCEVAFQKNDGTPDARRTQEDTSMAENELYSSWKSGQYQVKVQQTEAATRCRLAGSYTLCPGTDSLSLLDLDTSKTIYCWPYRLLRRFGTLKEGGVTIEAGRRCESGEGHFTFLSKQGSDIYRTMDEAIALQTRQLEPRPAPPPEPVTPTPIPKPPSFDKSRGSTVPPTLPRWNISLPELPTRPQPPPASPPKDVYSVIEMQPSPRAQPKPPRMTLSMLPSLPSRDSREEAEDERYTSVGSESGHQPDDDSMVYSKLSGMEDCYEDASNSQEQDCVYSRVLDHPSLPPPPTLRRSPVRTPEERVVVVEEDGEEEEEERERSEEGGAHVITTTSEIPVNFKQTLANILFKDRAKLQIHPTLPTERTDSDDAIYPKNFDM